MLLRSTILCFTFLFALPAFSQEDLTTGPITSVPDPAFQVRYFQAFLAGSVHFYSSPTVSGDNGLIAGQGVGGEAGFSWGYHHLSFGFSAGAMLSADPTIEDGREAAFRVPSFTLLGKFGTISRREFSDSWLFGLLGVSAVRYDHPDYREVGDSTFTTVVPTIGIEGQISGRGKSFPLAGAMRLEYSYPVFLDDRFQALQFHHLSLSLLIGIII